MEIEKKAATVEAAIEEGLAELQLQEKDVNIEILSKGSLLKKACVKLTVKPRGTEAAEVFLQNVLKLMGLDCTVNASEDDETCTLDLVGEDNGTAIGYRGDVLDSLQYLSLLVANKQFDMTKRVVVDAENYRAKRAETLTRLAHRLAHKAAKTGQVEKLEPMNPFERRVIHTALQDDKFVKTSSEGEEPRRCVVITPNQRPQRSYQERSSEGRPARERSESTSSSGYDYNEPKTTFRDDAATQDMYDAARRNEFKKSGGGKTRSFGAKKRPF